MIDGWSESLEGIPSFSIEYIESKNTAVLSKSKKAMKHFRLGEQLLEENFIDIASIYSKQSDKLFCLKWVCAASLKKQNGWTFMAFSKVDGPVSYAYCQCLAGKVRTCSPMSAVMKLAAKWATMHFKMLHFKPCTSKSCTWSVPQSRGKLPISEISLLSPASKKQKTIDENTTLKGIKSSSYDARIESQRVLNDSKVDEMSDFLSKEKPTIHALQVLNKSEKTFPETKFGMMPVGSVLSYQCSLIPAEFNIYSNLPTVNECDFNYLQFPDFPFSNTKNNIQSFIDKIKDASKLSILSKPKLDNNKVISIESSTRNQTNDPEWFKHRKNRFTASLCYRLGSNDPKISKSFKTLTHN